MKKIATLQDSELQRLIDRKKYVQKKINRAQRGGFIYKGAIKLAEWTEEVDNLKQAIRIHQGLGRNQGRAMTTRQGY